MLDTPIHITKKELPAEADIFQVHNLARNEGIWLQVENFDLRIKRTDEGISVSIYDVDVEADLELLSECCAFDNDTISFQE